MDNPVWLHAFVDTPAQSADAARSFWSAATGWAVGGPWPGHPEFASLLPPDGWPYAHLQVIDGPARVHLDMVVDDIDGHRERLVAIGAVAGERRDQWQVMSSPGGLPFCLCLEPVSARRPGPVRWLDGHRSRLTQLCIDSPPALADTELDFWRLATGWRYEPSAAPEFDGKLFPPDGGSMQLLLQRLDSTDGGTRAHIDLDTDDRAAEVERLVGLGARFVGDGRGWVVLTDPVGLPFCVTVQGRELAG